MRAADTVPGRWSVPNRSIARALALCAALLVGAGSASAQPTHVAVIGDSYIQQSSSGIDLISPSLNSASVSLVDVLAGQPWSLDPQLDNFGSGGGTSETMLASLPALIARRPDIAFLQGGHNDFIVHGAGYFDRLVANWTDMVQQLRRAGIRPILILDPPIDSVEGSTVVTLPELRSLDLRMNEWKRSYGGAHGILVWNWNTPLAEPGETAGGFCKRCSDDGVHPNFYGNMAVARQGLRDLAPILGASIRGATAALRTGAARIGESSDAYHPDRNPTGNLLANPLFRRSYTGALFGFAQGTYPSGWNPGSALVAAGKTVTGAVTPTEGGALAFQISVSGRASGGGHQMVYLGQRCEACAVLPAGTVVEGWVKVEVGANSPFSAVFAKAVAGGNVSLGNYWGHGIAGWSTYSPGPMTAWSGLIHIPPLAVPRSGFDMLTFYVQAEFDDGAGDFAGNVRFSRPALRVVREDR